MKSSLAATFAAAAAITALLVFVVNVAGDFMIPIKEVTTIAPPPATAAKTKPVAAPATAVNTAPPVKIAKTLRTAVATDATDVTRGAKVFNKCKACHTATKDGKDKFGPRLWGVVDRAKASVGGYKYSAALSGLGGKWSAADLDAFLKSPKKFAPGTKMPFAGLKKATDRAALIAFLRGPDGLGGNGGQPKPRP